MGIEKPAVMDHIWTTPNALKKTDKDNVYILKLPNLPAFRITTEESGAVSKVSFHKRSFLNFFRYFFSKNKKFEQLKSALNTSETQLSKLHLQVSERRSSALKIEQKFKAFLDRKNATPTSRFGYKEMTHPETGVTYYFDPNKKASHMRTAEGKLRKPTEGTFKSMLAQDGHFVTLKDKDARPLSESDIQRQQTLLSKLNTYQSVCRTDLVGDRVWVAHDGGKTVQTYLDSVEPLPMASFKQACLDLEAAHKDGIVFGDIKPKNMVIKDDMSMAKFIDVDGAQWQSLDNKILVSANNYTAKYYASGFLLHLYDNKPEIAKTLDNYCMLQTLCEATDIDLATVMETHDGRIKKGVCNDTNKSLFQSWCQDHVKPEYREQTLLFLSDPVENPLPESLSHIINWDAEPPQT